MTLDLTFSNNITLQANRHKKYLYGFIFIFCLLFFPIFLGNLYLNYIEIVLTNGVEFEASDWQDKSGATVGIAPANDGEKIFKTYKIKKIINQNKDINTIVFGSSTAMPIHNDMFPNNQKIYNFSTSSNPTHAIISELETLVEYDGFSYFVVPLEWLLALLSEGDYFDLWTTYDFWVESRNRVSWTRIMKDSLTTSKVKMLLSKIWSICNANNRYEAFQKMFFPSHGYLNEKKYPDGSIERNYNSPYNNKGFRLDGSINYLNYTPVLLLVGEAYNNWLISALGKYGGSSRIKLFPEHFERLSKIIKKVKSKKGDIFFFLPPIAPGLEKKILERSGASLLKLKDEIHKFGLANEVQIIDAGQSEKFGCEASDFFDPHHSVHTCYQKILPRFFNQRDKLGYGLISGDQLK